MDTYAVSLMNAPACKSTARSRREKENMEFGELARLLPLPSAITSQLDKASIIRLTTSFLNLRMVFPRGFVTWWNERYSTPSEPTPEIHEFGSHFMQTLDGFIFVLSPMGKIMYISETASVHLGLSQVELVGNSLFDYIHQSDQPILHEVLQGGAAESQAAMESGLEEFEVERMFFLRMKCVLAKRNAGLTDHGFKVIHCSGYAKYKHCNTLEAGAREDCVDNLGLVGVGYTLPPTSITEIRLSPYMFMFRASLEFKIVFLDSRVTELTGYPLQELLDKSIYELVHVGDIENMRSAHQILLEKHQVTTHYYRLLAKGGGWIWVQSQLTLIHIPRASRPSCIVGISSVISTCFASSSNIEHARVVLAPFQEAEKGSNGFPAPASKDTEEGPPSLGAYSERFYGPNGMLLVQPPPSYESHHHTVSPTAAVHPKFRGKRKRNPFQYKDALTGEKRYCLRDTAAVQQSHPTTVVAEARTSPIIQATNPMEYPSSFDSAAMFSSPQAVYPYISDGGYYFLNMPMEAAAFSLPYHPSGVFAPPPDPFEEANHLLTTGRDSVIMQTNAVHNDS